MVGLFRNMLLTTAVVEHVFVRLNVELVVLRNRNLTLEISNTSARLTIIRMHVLSTHILIWFDTFAHQEVIHEWILIFLFRLVLLILLLKLIFLLYRIGLDRRLIRSLLLRLAESFEHPIFNFWLFFILILLLLMRLVVARLLLHQFKQHCSFETL